ncbi:lantibiotic dehydratase [Streptomyces sp. NBC_00076]|uniref:lantibiotic dehydratase n=1 Tax=Streptomyces sp. NBC_00076 TaxID=2975642 RepID=UPI00324C45E4
MTAVITPSDPDSQSAAASQPSEAGRAWTLVPVVVLRQAGYPMELLDPLLAPDAAEEAMSLLDCRDRLAGLADEVKKLLRRHQITGGQQLSSRAGQLRPAPEAELSRALAGLPDDASATLRSYQEAATRLVDRWAAFAVCHRERLAAARLAVADTFTDPSMRQVLLLSNDAAYPEFSSWLDSFHGEAGARTRKMTDLLAMYLQRITTKNETHSHFGPIAVGRVVSETPGIAWVSRQSLERRSYFAHWAAERLAVAAGQTPGLGDHVRPRRRPLAFLRDERIDLYAFTTRDGLDVDWDFQHLGGAEVSPSEAWLWQRCNGDRTVLDLRTEWLDRHGPRHQPLFDEALRRLAEREWVIAEFEVPVGGSQPLAALRDMLPADVEPARQILDVITRFEQDLVRFSALPLAERPALLSDAKRRFERVTRSPANRNSGLHYADRSILFEEAHGELRDLTVGPDIARFMTDELSIVYDTVLAGPRLRMRQETAILTRWVTDRFGTGAEVDLDRLYADFFADRDRLAAECAVVDAELANLDEAMTGALLGDDTERREVVVPRERVEQVLSAYPDSPAAVCNPDILFAATSQEALRRGDFTAVIGDCHAVREVITHTSFGPLVQETAPQLLPEVYRGYLSLLDDDEVLVNLSRGHPDKTSTQLCYPCYDLEVYGRSAQTRDRVLQPSQLYVVVRDRRLELRARGVEGRLRLMAPPAGGPSIVQDPLSPFSFPRHFGGVGLRASALDHVPRIRCGRVVLHRETWRIPTARLRGLALSGDRVTADDAAQFLAICRLRAEHGLPQQVFVKVPGEPKPLYVDWDAPLLVRQLCRLARKTDGTMEISEMLPGRDHRWLETGTGRFTAELRCAVFSSGRRR